MMKVYAEPVAKEKKQIERNRTIGDRASAFARILIRTLHVAPCSGAFPSLFQKSLNSKCI